MLRIVRVADGEVISPAEALDLQTDAYQSIGDMMTQLFEAQALGQIRIEPSGEALQRLAVRAGLERFTARDRAEDGVRRFVPDRRGGRINRTAARMLELDAVNKREAIGSIMRFMSIEGPRAFASQAELLGALDPSVSTELISRQASAAVGDAVREGIEKGKAAAAPQEQTG